MKRLVFKITCTPPCGKSMVSCGFLRHSYWSGWLRDMHAIAPNWNNSVKTPCMSCRVLPTNNIIVPSCTHIKSRRDPALSKTSSFHRFDISNLQLPTKDLPTLLLRKLKALFTVGMKSFILFAITVLYHWSRKAADYKLPFHKKVYTQ